MGNTPNLGRTAVDTGSPRRIYGTAGGGLTNATWAANDAVAKVGQAGEVRTEKLLNRLTQTGGSSFAGRTALLGVVAVIVAAALWFAVRLHPEPYLLTGLPAGPVILTLGLIAGCCLVRVVWHAVVGVGSGRPTVLHDLAIPLSGITANIDHVVISGRKVPLIDSKAWAAGRYWTLGSTTRRGLTRFDHAHGRTPKMGQEAVDKLLAGKGLGAQVMTPLIAIWSSSKGAVRLNHFRYLDMPKTPSKAQRKRPAIIDSCNAEHIGGQAVHILGRLREADPQIVAALLPLVGALDSEKASR